MLYLIYKLIIHPNFISTIRNVPGPPHHNLFSGVLGMVLKAGPGVLHHKWVEEYGPTIQYRGFFGSNMLYISDPKALNHVLMSKCYEYPKPAQLRGEVARLFGRGILFAEGSLFVLFDCALLIITIAMV